MTMPRIKRFLQSSADAAGDIERLGAAFAAFRRTHKPGTRIPDALRGRVARALGQGVSRSRIQKACRLSWIQIKKMRSPQVVQRTTLAQPPRVLSVVDERAHKAAASDAVEIGIGEWRVSVTRVA
jgi:hypothetical protein